MQPMARLCIFGSHVVDDSLVADGREFLHRCKLAPIDRIPGFRAYITEKTQKKVAYHSQNLIGLLQGCSMSRTCALSLKNLAPCVGPSSRCHCLEEDFLAAETSSAGI